jgi:IS1 family transposase
MNRLPVEKRVAVVSALVEGNSLRATARMTGVARMTIEKLLRDLGTACAAYHDANVRNLTAQRIQCDEIWSFVGAKQKNVPEEKKGQWGDVWTWTALDADSRMIISYKVGLRNAAVAYDFMADVKSRLTNRVQLTTDSLKLYLTATEAAFGLEVDYAILEKQYGAIQPGKAAHVRYSPGKVTGMRAAIISGSPDSKHIITSHVERQNLTMRMHMRRFTRLTNAFSKRIDSHVCAVALHAMYYNFVRQHQTLRMSPAMAAGVTKKLWDMNDVVKMIETWETVWDRHN